MVNMRDLDTLAGEPLTAYRLVNSRFPPIDLFDDVADQTEFEAVYRIQSLTNPRLQNEVGKLELITTREIPFGIPGCSYAVAPFTHLNPEGSRFSDGSFGVLYVADSIETAIAEVRHHQHRYWSKVQALNYDRFTFRGLTCSFNDGGMSDAVPVPLADEIYAPADYTHSRQLGRALKSGSAIGLRYNSVRAPGKRCWALMTPRPMSAIVQSSHYEMVWNGGITSTHRLTGA